MPNYREGWIKPFDNRLKGKYLVTESGCWEWQGASNRDGYPVVASYRKNYRVSRMIFSHTYGPIAPWLGVLHNCMNRKCINPKHLRLGDDKSNARDLDRAKLTMEQVDYIRSSSKSNRELADELPVGIRQVWGIRRGDAWT